MQECRKPDYQILSEHKARLEKRNRERRNYRWCLVSYGLALVLILWFIVR